ncbi:RnfABCDGE type electron transport complex subunit D, partial [Paenibacillus sp. TAF58]
MTANQWIKTPKGYVVISLAALLFIASIWSLDFRGIYNGLIAVAVSSAVDTLCSRIAKRKRMITDGSVITGLIIALILSSTSSWYIVAA